MIWCTVKHSKLIVFQNFQNSQSTKAELNYEEKNPVLEVEIVLLEDNARGNEICCA